MSNYFYNKKPFLMYNHVLKVLTNVELYASWKDTLNNYWKDDFKDIHTSLDETIDACSQFY